MNKPKKILKHRVPFMMQYAYPQEFLDGLAKAMGIKWTKAEVRCVDASAVSVCPPPPSGILYYCDFKYKNDAEI